MLQAYIGGLSADSGHEGNGNKLA